MGSCEAAGAGAGCPEPEEVSVRRARTQEGGRLYIRAAWRGADLRLELFTEAGAWSGAADAEALRRLAVARSEPEASFLREARRCLAGGGDGSAGDGCLYELKPQPDGSALFVWKKKFEDGAVLRCGSLRVRPSDADDSLVDYLIKTNERLRQNLQETSSQNDELRCELEKCLSDLSRFNELKEEMERTLYGKFSQLLNAKKRRIQMLEQSLQNLNVTPSDIGAEMDF